MSDRRRSSRSSPSPIDRERDASAGRRRREEDRDRDQEHKNRHHHRSDEKRHRDDGEDDRRRRHHRSSVDDGGDSPSDADPRRERSSSRARDSVDREGREDSVERRRQHQHHGSSRKRREHGDEEELETTGKRTKVSDGTREGKRERRRFEDRADAVDSSGLNGVREKEACREEKRGEANISTDPEDNRSRKDGRRYSDKNERVVNSMDLGNGGQGNLSSEKSGATVNVVDQEPLKFSSNDSMTDAPSHPLSNKVSSITTTTENEGVSIRSDEVPGKSSTDGTTTSATSKSGSLSLDALAKAKKALQMQKELSERLKKIPLLNKVGTDNANSTQNSLSRVGALSGSSSSITQVQASSSLPVADVSSINPSVPNNVGVLPGLTNMANIEAIKRAQELAAKMGFRQDPEAAPLINMFPGQLTADVTVPLKPAKAPVLRLDAQGREIDEHGNVISMTKPANLSTLKVNINKQKKDAFQIIRPDLDAIAKSSSHFDENMGINKTKLLRPKRMSFQFVEEGKWSKQAEIIKFKSQFGEAQAKELKIKQAQLAKAKAEPEINPNLIAVGVRFFKEKQKEEVPEIEWWDKPILPSGIYGDPAELRLNMEKISIYVEHPRPIEPPAEPAPPPPQPLKLTKKEQKKLRTQRRLAKERDRQEMIRQGLLEPPKTKIKMSNLMKVLASEATQDPTKMEMEIRSAAAEREQAHVDRNIARKLTPAERREKKERKLFDDSNNLETIVSVYKIRDLSHPQNRFKVDINAQENRLTGCVVISDEMTVVVVEGGKKPIKRYGKLMLKRINWAAAMENEDDETEEGDSPANSCVLVWQGSVAKPTFSRFLVHQCVSDAAAKKVFADAGVPHYWDLCVNFSEELI